MSILFYFTLKKTLELKKIYDCFFMIAHFLNENQKVKFGTVPPILKVHLGPGGM